MAMLESSNRLVVDLNQARIPEAWRRRRFYIKPKVKRNMHKWNGVIKRKRRDFNYRLRWALKSMSRYTPSKKSGALQSASSLSYDEEKYCSWC